MTTGIKFEKRTARDLQSGDVIGSGETVVRVAAGVRTPRGKVEVTLRRPDGTHRTGIWNAGTKIGVYT